MLRCVTWLVPGLPLGLFETVCDATAAALGTTAQLEVRAASSGPDPDDDPFARDEFDIGFMCTPSYRRLAAAPNPTVRLIGAAPVFRDDRNMGAPVYFAEIVVGAAGAASGARGLADLAGHRIGYNDANSWSGRVAILDRLRALDLDESFATFVPTGSHHQSLEQLAAGTIDAASIDSNTLLAVGLPDGTRVVETLGPFPIQPVVARASLTDKTRHVIAGTLLELHEHVPIARQLRAYGVERFAPVSEDDYR